jgi:hypothetical protein
MKATANLNNWCQACSTGSQVYPKPFRQSSIFTPHSLTLVNLSNLNEDRLSKDGVFQRLILAKYLNLYQRYGTTLEECLQVSPEEDTTLDLYVKEWKAKGLDQDTIDKILESMDKVSPKRKGIRDKIMEHVNRLIQPADGNVFYCALKGYEFMETRDGSTSIHLDRIVENATQNNHPNFERISEFPSEMERIGVANSYALNDLYLTNLRNLVRFQFI